MGNDGSERASQTEGARRRPRWIFQLERLEDRTVIRVLDTREDTVFREIPIEEFLAYARHNKNVTAFLLGKLPEPANDPN
ncbi:MAG: hypothetical protein ACYTDU_08525 [Planctomycetota bacterium]|jgi:hypothetical protein